MLAGLAQFAPKNTQNCGFRFPFSRSFAKPPLCLEEFWWPQTGNRSSSATVERAILKNKDVLDDICLSLSSHVPDVPDVPGHALG